MALKQKSKRFLFVSPEGLGKAGCLWFGAGALASDYKRKEVIGIRIGE